MIVVFRKKKLHIWHCVTELWMFELSDINIFVLLTESQQSGCYCCRSVKGLAQKYAFQELRSSISSILQWHYRLNSASNRFIVAHYIHWNVARTDSWIAGIRVLPKYIMFLGKYISDSSNEEFHKSERGFA